MKQNQQTFLDLVDELKQSQSWKEVEGSNATLALMLGVSSRTIYRWQRGETDVPMTAILLLRMLLGKN